MKRIAFLVLCIIFARNCHAEITYLTTIDGVRLTSESIVRNVSLGNFDAAWGAFKLVASVPEAEYKAAYAQTFGKLPEQALRWGASQGYEWVSEEYIGTRIVRCTLMIIYDDMPIRWVLNFYRKRNGWSLMFMNYDGNVPGWPIPGANPSSVRAAPSGP